jgi:hypothetical protein
MRVGDLRRVLRDSGVLGDAGGEPTPAELADALWLAALRRASRRVPPVGAEAPPAGDVPAEREDRGATEKPAKPSQAEPSQPSPIPQPDLPEPTPAQPSPVLPVLATLPVRGTPPSGVMVSAAARPQLPDSLSLARAMRPLRRRVPSATRHVLDEEATADLQAEQRLWLPALAPGNEPAFDLALVVDDSESMALWGEKVREFRLLCERLGAFRDVRLWHLSATGDGARAQPVLRGLPRTSGGRDERELVDPSGRRLILVVTDGVHPRWRPAGPLGPVLARWALASPLAIVQPFPQRLWNRSPLRPVIEEFRPGWPGSGPTIRCSDQVSVAVPILELAPAAMRRWAEIISGTSGIIRMPAAALSPSRAGDDEATRNVQHGDGVVDEEPDPARLVRNFRASVSPAAYQLAGYLSAAPLTLPVMRLVQESMMPGTGPAELAEVFLSGLLRRSVDSDPAADAESASYVFAAGVRDVLQSTLTRGEALTVLEQVGSYLVRGRQGGRPFPVLLRGQPVGSDIEATAEQFPAAFGRIAGPLLDRIGGPYADAIRREATPTAPVREEPRDGWISYGPSLGRIYQPVLFVGLGGAGCDIGAELERQLRIQICGPDGNEFRKLHAKEGMRPYQLPSCVQFVYADVNQAELDRLPRRVVPGPEHVPAAAQTAHYVTGLVPDVASYPDLAMRLRLQVEQVVEGWLPPATDGDEPKVNFLHRGVGQFPTIGRAALFGTFMDGIAPAVRDIREAIGRLSNSGEDLHALGGRPPRGVDVFVAFSVAGGTGSGIFYDYLHLIAYTLQQNTSLRVKIYPLVLMPSAFEEGLGGGRAAGLNAARALIDLFRLVDQQNGADAPFELRSPFDQRSVDPEEVAVSYPGNQRIVMRPGTVQTGFLFSRPAEATREDMYRSIVSLVMSLVGTELSEADYRSGEQHQSFADSFVNEAGHRQVPAENGIGNRGVSTAQVASLTVPVDELAGIIGGRLLREAIGQLSQADGLLELTGALRDFARADAAGFARRSAELYRRRAGVSYLLPSSSGQLEEFYQLVLRRLREQVVRDRLFATGSSTSDVLQALVGADMWPEAFRLSAESSPENAVSFLREKVTTEVKKFLREPRPGERPLLPRLHDLLTEAAGHGVKPGPTIDQNYLVLRGALAGLLPPNFTPQGSGPLKVLITYPTDTDSPVIEAYLRSALNLPTGPRVTVDFRPARPESISVVMFRTAMGVTEVDEVRDLLRLWARAQSNPHPTDLLRWRQRTGYNFGYLATTEENRVEILHRILCTAWNGRATVVGPEASPERIKVRLGGGVTMTLPLTPLGRASSWASLLHAYELWALDNDDLHRRFAGQLMRELPSGLDSRPEPPSEVYLAIRDMAAGQIEILDDMLTKTVPGQPFRAAQMRDFWATTLPCALDQEFAQLEQPAAANLRELEAAVGRGRERPEEDSVAARLGPAPIVAAEAGTGEPGRSGFGNPFTYGNPISDPRRFFGRSREVDLIFGRLSNSEFESSSVVGDRRIGKTSLLNYLADPQVQAAHGLGPDRYIFVYADLQMVDKTMGPERLWRQLLMLMRRRVPEGEIIDAVTTALERSEPLSTFDLDELFQQVDDKGLNVVFLLDEFEWITINPNFGLSFYHELRSLIIHHRVALVATSRMNLAELLPDVSARSSPFFNVLATINLRPFSFADFQIMVSRSLSETAVRFSEPEMEKVLDLAGLHPFFLQAACCMLYDSHHMGLQEAARSSFLKEHFRAEAIPHIVDYWDQSGDYEKIVLIAAALLERKDRSARGFSLDDLREVFPGGEPTVGRLEERGLLTSSDGRYRLFSSVLGPWILDQITAEPSGERSYNDWLAENNELVERITGRRGGPLRDILPKIGTRHRRLILTWASDPRTLAAVSALLDSALAAVPSSRIDRDSRRAINPYVAGSPVTGTEMFFGREDVFSFVRRNLTGRHRDTPIVFYGQRRTGKTSVLYQLHRHLNPSYRCIFIDLHGLQLGSMENLMLGIAHAISRGLRRDHLLTVEVPDRAAFMADPRSAFETAFLDRVWSALGEDHLVLMLDEVLRLEEEIRAGRLDREVFNYLRHLMQHHARLNFIFSMGAAMEEMKKDYTFLFSVALYHRISFLEPAAARELITQPVQDHYQIAPQAVAKIIQVTSGHPYYIQLLCHCIFDSWSRAPKPALSAEDVDAALPDALELGSPNLTYVWQDSTPEEQALMAGMADAMRRGTGPVTADQIRDAWRKVGVSLSDHEFNQALRSLISREVVVGSTSYSFAVDLQRLWLRQHRRLDQVRDELAPKPRTTRRRFAFWERRADREGTGDG